MKTIQLSAKDPKKKYTHQSSRDGAALVGRAGNHGLHNHRGRAGLHILIGDLAAVGGGRGERLLEVNGSDHREPSQIVLVRPHGWERPAVGVQDGSEYVLLGRRGRLWSRVYEGRKGVFGDSEG